MIRYPASQRFYNMELHYIFTAILMPIFLSPTLSSSSWAGCVMMFLHAYKSNLSVSQSLSWLADLRHGAPQQRRRTRPAEKNSAKLV
ncbi:hypothetical protein RRG08_043801 [Elysia crispata]|uniref:Uncharacterized protein n=1 Tax=Elysia crispata TaxID=231223 RepID=A0AAE0Z4I7_9GAST|nr:hypothetical protein RRG08_043801 [Elysia crispata]